ncbi:nickel-dependent hydrogenase large subunit [Escherichia coli]
MRCEVNINDQNVITNAVSCAPCFAGWRLTGGRDPRDAWAFVERICGVCTGVHALASVYAIEDAIGIKVPDNANIIRNISRWQRSGATIIWCTSISSPGWMDPRVRWAEKPTRGNLRTGAKSLLMAEIIPAISSTYKIAERNSLKAGSWGSSQWLLGYCGYKLPPEANLMGFAHYLEALDFQREIVKIHAVFGGKLIQTGLSAGCLAPLHRTKAARSVVNMERLNLVQSIITRTADFINNVMIPRLSHRSVQQTVERNRHGSF